MLLWRGVTWLAALAFGGRWNADEAMMQEASPAQCERIVRLCEACLQNSTTELCEAAITVTTITPGNRAQGICIRHGAGSAAAVLVHLPEDVLKGVRNHVTAWQVTRKPFKSP